MKVESKAPTGDTTIHNLRDLIWLRGILIAGVSLLIAVAWFWLGLKLPLLPLSCCLVLLALWNLFSAWRSTRAAGVSRNEFLVQLLADVLVITGLLYFTGGATNPFIWIYLIPLVLATTLLSRAAAWFMAALAIGCYTLLMVHFIPLPGTGDMAHHHGFGQHVVGMWLGFVLSALLVVHFVSDIAENLHRRDRQLADARERALKDERLIALGTLAAGAAHELGTPLGTMAILIRDMVEDHPPSGDAELHEQLRILEGEVQRCREAMKVISASSGVAQADAGRYVAVDRFVLDLRRNWLAGRKGVCLDLDLPNPPPTAAILADQTLIQALNAILNNAADASPDSVAMQVRWDASVLRMRILDRGEGLSAAVGQVLGDEQVSTKEQGLGLGLFLAHASIGRLGGSVSLRDRTSGGTCTEILLPLISSDGSGCGATVGVQAEVKLVAAAESEHRDG